MKCQTCGHDPDAGKGEWGSHDRPPPAEKSPRPADATDKLRMFEGVHLPEFEAKFIRSVGKQQEWSAKQLALFNRIYRSSFGDQKPAAPGEKKLDFDSEGIF